MLIQEDWYIKYVYCYNHINCYKNYTKKYIQTPKDQERIVIHVQVDCKKATKEG